MARVVVRAWDQNPWHDQLKRVNSWMISCFYHVSFQVQRHQRRGHRYWHDAAPLGSNIVCHGINRTVVTSSTALKALCDTHTHDAVDIYIYIIHPIGSSDKTHALCTYICLDLSVWQRYFEWIKKFPVHTDQYCEQTVSFFLWSISILITYLPCPEVGAPEQSLPCILDIAIKVLVWINMHYIL